MFCPACGANLSDNVSFCDKCGVPVSTNNPVKPETSVVPQPAQAPIKANSTNKATLIALLCAVILIVAVLLIFVFPPKSKSVSGSKDFGEGSKKDPTSATKDVTGLPAANKYAECFAEYPDFVLPESNRRYYGRVELVALSDEALEIACQELYARYGAEFGDEDLRQYFEKRDWYQKDSQAFSFNNYEEANLLLIETCIAQREGRLTKHSNPLLEYLPKNGNLLSNSNSNYLTAIELSHLNADQLMLARNEIFARHGYTFSDSQLLQFFYCMDWYTPAVAPEEFSDASLNEYEQGNLALIQIYEQRVSGVSFSSTNPYQDIFNAYDEYIFPQSATANLNPYELTTKDKDTLCIARNEILARHGYTFKDQDLLEYFLQRSWYQPATPPGRTDLIKLSDIENENIMLIKEAEGNLADMPNLDSLDTSLSVSVNGVNYSVKIPAYWMTYATYSNSGNRLRFCETQSINDAGGHVFTLVVFSGTDEYEFLPSYRLIGYLQKGSEQQHLVAMFPTDVQFVPSAAAMYNKMRNEIDRIIATITPTNGYTFFPA